jgi:hypothetical protein
LLRIDATSCGKISPLTWITSADSLAIALTNGGGAPFVDSQGGSWSFTNS